MNIYFCIAWKTWSYCVFAQKNSLTRLNDDIILTSTTDVEENCMNSNSRFYYWSVFICTLKPYFKDGLNPVSLFHQQWNKNSVFYNAKIIGGKLEPGKNFVSKGTHFSLPLYCYKINSYTILSVSYTHLTLPTKA